ncbi:SGNH/GDSL hydrolase family protein [Rhizobium mesosinicum]|uniref:SGNH/GDSL hydrolase family protein n=1 Tax=Rhizobium mesosinicum TaxID=335017 RepID=A0ABS7GYY6_9HYPH|nr:SGNH/GDSL hydrolase family protein [Rhizobium mesosinicum]MBW9054931.1 SGNH/GDSL hydrolase family protein [Rhizobium mesosinicum]
MAKLFNMQRVQGVVIVADGTRMFNNRPVIGIRDVGDTTTFSDNRPVLGVDIVADGAAVYNDLPVLGAVRISDGRRLYGNAPVVPVKGANVAVPLPALPLAAGAKIMGLGHSFIGLGTQQTFNAGQTATQGHQGFYENGRTVLSWIKAADGRFNIDMFAELSHPFFAPSSFAAFSGAMGGKSGDCLFSVPGQEVQFPGTLARTAYALGQKPDIVYVDIGYNDIVRNRSLAAVIADLDSQLQRLTDAGIHVVLQTLSWTSTLNDDPVNDSPEWPGILDGINAWILNQEGRDGVTLCDTLALDGPASGIPPAMFVDGLHPKPELMARRADILLPILRAMVSAGETRSLDPLAAYNIFPQKGTPGTSGTKTNVTGDVSANMRLIRGTGTSTYVGSKEVVAAGNEKQVVTITPVNDGLAVHTVTYGTTSSVTLAALGLVAGDWLEIEIPVELNDWAGWDYLDSSIRGPVQVANTVTVTGGGWTTGNYIGGRGRSLVCGSKLWLPTGLTMTNLRLDNLVVLRHLCNTGGTGIAKIGAPIIRKIGSPRLAWNLAA